MMWKAALAIITIAVAMCTVSTLAAQSPKPGRKLVQSVKPEYPATLKQAQIGGLVRLSATVLPNGTVSAVEIRGGNPILAEKAQEAVMHWKYASGPSQTVEEISVSFTPH